ncbi:melanoma-associated antigen 11-like [Thomomys bottae]
MSSTQSTEPPEQQTAPQAQREAADLVDEQGPQAQEASTPLVHPTLPDLLVGLLGEIVRQSNEGHRESHHQGREELGLQDAQLLLQTALQKEALGLVRYLLQQYRLCQPVTDVDMLSRISRSHQRYFPRILRKACICLQLLFGVEMKEVDPFFHMHALVLAAGITYDGTLSHVRGMPKTGLLIIVLCIVFTEGGCATEEAIWQVLSEMQVYPDREHFIYGNPRRLLMEDFVWEQYLECQQVPRTDPVIYKFRWGPRAYAETTQQKVLEHWAKNSGIDPRAIPSLYEEALREQEANTHDIAFSIEE